MKTVDLDKKEPAEQAQGILTTFGGLFSRPGWYKSLSVSTMRADALAGLTGAALVLPQGVAFATIAGLPPEYGFYTAMVPPIVAAMLGSSLHAVSGPTTAISVLVFGSLSEMYAPTSPEFISAAITLAVLVGVFQLIFSFARLGGIVDFVSHSVMTGFVTSAAFMIAFSQLPHALGLDIPRRGELGETIRAYAEALPEADGHTCAIAAIAFATGWLVKRLRPVWPNYLIALTAATAAGQAFAALGADFETIGALERVMPTFLFPDLSLGTLRELATAGLAISMVGLLEAMSISRAISMRSGQLVDGNREFFGQGASNLIGGFFQCYPSSASFTRSGANFDAGARTPLSSVFAALFLFATLLLVAPWLVHVPVAALAGVIILVAWRLIDIPAIRHIMTTSASETAILLTTFVVALAINLEAAIYAGFLMSLALFLKRTAKPFVGIGAPDPSTPQAMFRNAELYNLTECPQILFVRVDGPLYFGSVEYLRRMFRAFEAQRPEQKHMVLIAKGAGEIDMPVADLLIEESQRRSARGGSFHLLVKSPRSLTKLARFRVVKHLGTDHIHLTKTDAISEVVPTVDQNRCANCTARIFRECPSSAK